MDGICLLDISCKHFGCPGLLLVPFPRNRKKTQSVPISVSLFCFSTTSVGQVWDVVIGQFYICGMRHLAHVKEVGHYCLLLLAFLLVAGNPNIWCRSCPRSLSCQHNKQMFTVMVSSSSASCVSATIMLVGCEVWKFGYISGFYTREYTAPHVSPRSYRILNIWLRKHTIYHHICALLGPI